MDGEKIRVKCTDELGNVAYVYGRLGESFRCVLANDIPASMSYAVGYCKDEVGLKFKLEDATSETEVLEIVRAAAGKRHKIELV